MENLGALNLLTALLYGEARGENLIGKYAVAFVVKNRVKDRRWPKTWEKVMLQEKQFSCFNENDVNFRKVVHVAEKWNRYKDRHIIRECRHIAHGVIYKWVTEDPTNGANHFHSTSITPYWADKTKVTKIIGNHKFYKL